MKAGQHPRQHKSSHSKIDAVTGECKECFARQASWGVPRPLKALVWVSQHRAASIHRPHHHQQRFWRYERPLRFMTPNSVTSTKQTWDQRVPSRCECLSLMKVRNSNSLTLTTACQVLPQSVMLSSRKTISITLRLRAIHVLGPCLHLFVCCTPEDKPNCHWHASK